MFKCDHKRDEKNFKHPPHTLPKTREPINQTLLKKIQSNPA
jgi:hypothetical protein